MDAREYFPSMIETERLVLRLPVAGDAGSVAEALADPEVMRFIGTGETGTLADAVEQVELMLRAWEEDGFGRFIVVRAEDGATLGRVGLLAWDPNVWRSGIRSEIGDRAEIELGWTFVRKGWGQGYATEAAAAVRDWALREVQLRRLVSLIHPGNTRSMSVATRIGERFEATITTHRGVPSQLWSLPGSSGVAAAN
jgi:RimJ/RimL family protein N-acetyltransferase